LFEKRFIERIFKKLEFNGQSAKRRAINNANMRAPAMGCEIALGKAWEELEELAPFSRSTTKFLTDVMRQM
jgi:hypothetical protein